MDYKVFYRKYRPCNFNELVGQDYIKEILVNSIKTGRIAHAYIFTGPRGTGKTSTAKIFAKTLNCINSIDGVSCDSCENCKTYNESADIIEIDAASNNGVEEIRTLRDSVKIAPYNSKYKVYIIDEVHMLSNSAWNAFLKTLEEPPSHVIFILATTEINKIPETVMSRCQRFDFSRISEKIMYDHLLNICKKENVNIEHEALKALVNLSNGCLRDSLSYLDKISKCNDKITLDIIQNNFGVISKAGLEDLYNNIILGNKNKICEIIDNYSNHGLTPLNFINEFVDYLLNKIINPNTLDSNEILQLKDIIYKLNKITVNFNSIVNPFTLIKVELITINYFPGNNCVDISHNNEKKTKENDVNINSELKNDKLIESHSVNNISKIDISKIREIRINNSFVDVSKELKNKFINLWKKFNDELSYIGNYNLLGYLENSNIEVVSKTNVLFSFKIDNEAILFNENVVTIESSFNESNNSNYKFFALSDKEWLEEKKKYIENKNKQYEYIEENIEENIVENVKSFDLAENIFGEDIIEIR